MIEIFKDIPSYKGLYQVSNLGRVKALSRTKTYPRFEAISKERILRPSSNSKGYQQVLLYKDGISRGFKVHRLVLEAFVPNPDNLPLVNHKDENVKNNSVDNLEWCTHQYNIIYSNKNFYTAYNLTSPAEKFSFNNLSTFCKQHNIYVANACKVLKYKRRHTGGWVIYKN